MKKIIKDKKIICSIIVVGILLIIMGVIFTKDKLNVNYRIEEEITKITVGETHYIDSSLLNIPISIPYEVNPSNADPAAISIISSDNSIVKINDDNTMTALKKGEIDLTFVAKNNTKITAGLHIVVE